MDGTTSETTHASAEAARTQPGPAVDLPVPRATPALDPRADPLWRAVDGAAADREQFHHLAALAAAACGVPAVRVALVHGGQERVLGVGGPDVAWRARLGRPQPDSLCQQVVDAQHSVLITDARTDPRVVPGAGAAAVATHGVVGYLGVPLRSAAGEVLGAVCAVDRRPREWTQQDVAVLERVAQSIRTEGRLLAATVQLGSALRVREAVVTTALDAVVVSDRAGRVLEFNPAAELMFGRRRAEVLGLGLTEVVVPEHLRDAHDAGLARYLSTGRATMMGSRVRTFGRRADGSVFPVELTLTSTRLEAGADDELFVAHVRDRSGEERLEQEALAAGRATTSAERELSLERQRLTAVLAAAQTILFSLDLEGRFEVSTGQGLALLGLAPGEVVGQLVWEVYAGRPDVLDGVRRALDGEPVQLRLEVAEHALEVQMQPVVDGVGVSCGVVGVVTDTTAHTSAERALRSLVEVDALTGLSTRGHAEHLLEELLADDEPVALLLVDLDDFKDINDSLGHGTGDEVLRLLARRLAAVVPEAAVLGRLGGDEVLVVLRGAGLAVAAAVADRVLAAVAEPVPLRSDGRSTGEPVELRVTASIGIAAAPQHGRTPTELLARADSAMYSAKRSGRATSAVYEARTDTARRRLTLTTRLRRTIAAGRLDVVYQPTVHLTSGATSSFEALARWVDPDLGAVSPEEFIPLAEQSNLIEDLFELVLDRALTAATSWRSAAGASADGGAAVGVAVNLAPRQLRDPGLPARLVRAAEHHHFPVEQLVVELTESAAMDDAVVADAVLRGIRDTGVVPVIDDFGVAYSSMARLRDLSVDGVIRAVKLDRSFVHDLPGVRARTLLATFVDMTRSLGLAAVAEGIETEEHLDIVRGLGCQYGQGWHYARAMPAEDAVRWLQRPQA